MHIFTTFLFVALFPLALGQETLHIIPNVEGEGETGFGWNRKKYRVQQLYDASLLAPGGIITEIAFRYDCVETNLPYSSWCGQANDISFAWNIELYLSTTQKQLATSHYDPGALSGVFANNHGNDKTQVFNKPFSFPRDDTEYDAENPSAGPFTVVFELESPYLYDSSGGNLLLEIVNRDSHCINTYCHELNKLDAVNGNVLQSVYRFGRLDRTDGGVARFAMVTQFKIVPDVKEVEIDVQPGDAVGCLNVDGNGAIPVAIFGSSTFIVLDVVVDSLSFNGLEVKANKHGRHQCSPGEDLNGDGYNDLMCQMQDDSGTDGWQEDTDGIGSLTGSLLDGTAFIGQDQICVVKRPPNRFLRFQNDI